jgi:hypothetical protein
MDAGDRKANGSATNRQGDLAVTLLAAGSNVTIPAIVMAVLSRHDPYDQEAFVLPDRAAREWLFT